MTVQDREKIMKIYFTNIVSIKVAAVIVVVPSALIWSVLKQKR